MTAATGLEKVQKKEKAHQRGRPKKSDFQKSTLKTTEEEERDFVRK